MTDHMLRHNPMTICRVQVTRGTRKYRTYGTEEPDTKITWSHDGPCKIGLHLLLMTSHTEEPEKYTGAWYLRRAIDWAEGLDEFDELIVIAERVLKRPIVDQYYVEVSAEEKQAVNTLANEARDYWDMCNYASDEDEEDRILGQASPGGFFACWIPPEELTRVKEEVPRD